MIGNELATIINDVCAAIGCFLVKIRLMQWPGMMQSFKVDGGGRAVGLAR